MYLQLTGTLSLSRLTRAFIFRNAKLRSTAYARYSELWVERAPKRRWITSPCRQIIIKLIPKAAAFLVTFSFFYCVLLLSNTIPHLLRSGSQFILVTWNRSFRFIFQCVFLSSCFCFKITTQKLIRTNDSRSFCGGVISQLRITLLLPFFPISVLLIWRNNDASVGCYVLGVDILLSS